MEWIYLLVAGILEVTWAVFMKIRSPKLKYFIPLSDAIILKGNFLICGWKTIAMIA